MAGPRSLDNDRPLPQKGGPSSRTSVPHREPGASLDRPRAPGSADLIIACRLVVAAGGERPPADDPARTGLCKLDVKPPDSEFKSRNPVETVFESDLLAARGEAHATSSGPSMPKRRWSIISMTRSTRKLIMVG